MYLASKNSLRRWPQQSIHDQGQLVVSTAGADSSPIKFFPNILPFGITPNISMLLCFNHLPFQMLPDRATIEQCVTLSSIDRRDQAHPTNYIPIPRSSPSASVDTEKTSIPLVRLPER